MSMLKKNAYKQHAHHTDIDESTLAKIHSFHTLQKLFMKSIFLCHFNSEQHLYINVNLFKQYGFDTIIYYVDDNLNNNEFFWQKIQSILFLSKLLTSAEWNYWFMKMKTAKLVWVVWKVWHLIESVSEKTIVFTDHSVTIFIAQQTHPIMTVLTDKLNF